MRYPHQVGGFTMTEPWLTTREAVKAAVDAEQTVRSNRALDAAIAAASRHVESQLHRRFRPLTGVKRFNWPDWPNPGLPYVLWLNQHELISVTSLVSGGTTITDYFLEPNAEGPPYRKIELDLSTTASFDVDDTHQRSIVITGVWGWADDQATVGTLNGAVGSTTATTIVVDDPTEVGVGDLLTVNSERMFVTGRTWTAATSLLDGALTAEDNVRTVTVDDGTEFDVGETILVGAEEMLVTSISSNDLTVRRAVEGSVLAAHADNAAVSRSTTLTVERGALGSTAATHSDADAVTRHVVEPEVEDYVISKALVLVGLKRAGMSAQAVAGQGQGSSSNPTGDALAVQLEQLKVSHGRRARVRSI